MSTTLIQPGLEFKLGYEALIERRRVRGAAWRYVTERNGNKTQLGNMPLWLPPVELQREFGRRVSAVKAMTTLHGSATKLGQDAASSLAGSMLAAR